MRIPHIRDGLVQTTATYRRIIVRRLKRMEEASSKLALMASFLVVAGIMLFTSSIPALAAAAPSVSEQQVQYEARELQRYIANGSPRDLKDKQAIERSLEDAIGGRSWWWGWLGQQDLRSCWVAMKLTHTLELITHLQQKQPSSSLEEAYNRVWIMRNDILQSLPADEQCEGVGTVLPEPAVKLGESDNKHVSLDVAFGLPTLTTVKADNQTFTRVHVPGVENMVGAPGEPAVPMWRKLIALPEGATPKLTVARQVTGETLQLNLVPFQEQAVDQAAPDMGDGDTLPKPDPKTFADKPFQLNKQSYATNRLFPEQPCRITPMGQYRDVQMAQLECATAQYNPVSDRYMMNQSVRVEVVFENGADTFITSRTFNAFEGAAKLTTESVLNRQTIADYIKDVDLTGLGCSGEELLILTHQNFREAADNLAEHKRSMGLSTSVFNVGSGVSSRDTAEEIDDFIEDRYDECRVRPSYVLLMGDVEFIPTFYPADLPDNAGSDFPYANYVQILFDAFFPDFGVGRIPVDTNAQAQTVVDKIVDYEAHPPFAGFGSGTPFYNTVGLASQFQCCRMNGNGTPLNSQAGTDQRAFIETSEFGRNELLDQGYSVPRIYTRTVDGGGYCIQQNASGTCTQTQAAYSGDATPRRYFNGTLLPSDIGAGSGFMWNGSTANITDAWNAGRFLFVHRDHGWPGGWGDPGFSSSDVDALSNGDRLPVVWSVNCASGLFDNETAGGTYGTTMSGTYFAERALRKADGGAIGVIGDTRNSPTWANNALTRGFFDAVWPGTIPGHGGSTSFKRLGDTLNWGKVYLASQVGVEQTAGGVSVGDMGYEYHIWNLIGDPSLAMWTKNPHRLILDAKFSAVLMNSGERIKYAQDGATITKLQVTANGEVRAIGRATVVNGVADMQYFEQPEPRAQTIYSASFADSASVTLTPTDTEPSPSD